MNDVAQWLKGEMDLVEKSKALGIPRKINHDTALLAFRRCLEEIQRLEIDKEQLRMALGGGSEMKPLGDSRC